jgi:hypothetical protein
MRAPDLPDTGRFRYPARIAPSEDPGAERKGWTPMTITERIRVEADDLRARTRPRTWFGSEARSGNAT